MSNARNGRRAGEHDAERNEEEGNGTIKKAFKRHDLGCRHDSQSLSLGDPPGLEGLSDVDTV